jgi:hypothetical protein
MRCNYGLTASIMLPNISLNPTHPRARAPLEPCGARVSSGVGLREGRTMTAAALLVGLLIAAVGIIGLVAPGQLLSAGRYFVTPLGLYLAAAVRITFGIVFLGAAPQTRTPTTLRIFGLLILLNGILTVFVGTDRARGILEWWSAQGLTVTRLFAGLVLAFGAFVIYTVTAGRRPPP